MGLRIAITVPCPHCGARHDIPLDANAAAEVVFHFDCDGEGCTRGLVLLPESLPAPHALKGHSPSVFVEGWRIGREVLCPDCHAKRAAVVPETH